MDEERGHHLPIYVDYLESSIGIRENTNKPMRNGHSLCSDSVRSTQIDSLALGRAYDENFTY